MRSLLARICVIASAVFGGGCSEEPSTGLSRADVEAITRLLSGDGKQVVFGVQRTSETEVTAWATAGGVRNAVRALATDGAGGVSAFRSGLE